jgi:FSR family fosmidomycin resistance protein-like MFS transporter
MLPILTITHPLVDACSMSVLAAGGMSWSRILLYNAVAFALQLPMGVVLDARPGLVRVGFVAGTCLVCAATLAAAFDAGGWGVLVAVCLGNAIFHLTAGKHVLEAHGGRSGPIGLFISTGALGLLAGKLGVEHAAAVSLPTFAALLAACVVVAGRGVGWRTSTGETPVVPVVGRGVLDAPPSTGETPVVPVVILAGLFVLVAWRSWAGLEATRLTATEGMSLVLAGAAVTWGGKAVGGYLAERLGRWTVTAASVCGSAALAFACSPQNALAWLLLLFVAQLATGPVLSLVYDRMDGKGGTAFGLNCLGLFAGSL